MDHDHMETGSITALGNGWYYSSEINKKFRFGERGEVVTEDGTVLASAPLDKGGAVHGDDPEGDAADAEEDTLP
jgi:hypothetical protein